MKVDGWQKKLEGFLWSREHSPFEWGTNDCCIFACDGVEVMTGIDPACWFRGKYHNRKQAFRSLREFSGGSVKEMADKIQRNFRWKTIPNDKREFGDLALIVIDNIDEEASRLSNQVTLGIVCRQGYIATPSIEGLAFNHNPQIIRVARV